MKYRGKKLKEGGGSQTPAKEALEYVQDQRYVLMFYYKMTFVGSPLEITATNH